MHVEEVSPEPRIRLTEARTSRGWSQQEVANRIGTTHVNVSRWERGITRPSPYFRRKLCTLYNKSEYDLELGHIPDIVESMPTPTSLSSHAPLYDPAIPVPTGISLVGRETELSQLKRRLFTGGSVALTALNGLPGVGKTTLAITLAHDPEVRAYFRDGILWAGLGPTPNLPGLLSRWGTLLGISSTEMATLTTPEAWAMALRTAIGTRRMLLVADDAWEVEEALTFKVGGPVCAHLVTTRFPAIAVHVAGDGATIIRELSEDESLTLLRVLAPLVVSTDVQKAQTLVQVIGGLPLALTLIGNYLRMQSYSGHTRRIHQALERLSDAEVRLHISEPRGPVERHPSLPTDASLSLQSVIAVTDQQLDEDARATLYALAVFPPKPNSFSEGAALAVTALPIEALDTVIDAGLLEGSGTDRYTLHQVIADYARVQLKKQTPHDRYDRMIAYMIAFVEQHKKDYELLDLESSNIHAALEIAFDLGREAELVRGVCAFAPFLLLRGLYIQAERYLLQAHDAALALNDKRGIISTLLYLGETAQKQGNYAQAESSYQQGLTLAREIEDRERISALLNNLGWVNLKRGEYTQAETYLQEGLPLARQIGDSERISGLLEMFGSVAGSRGDYAQSEAYLQEGLTIARQVGDRERLCTILINLGEIATSQGRNLQAEVYFQEGLIVARQIGHPEWISALLLNLGSTTRRQGNYAQAEDYFQESLVLARQIGRSYIVCNTLYELGNLHLNRNEVKASEAIFHEMLTAIPEEGQELFALAQYGLARVAIAKGNISEALNLGEASLTILEAIGHRSAEEVRHWLKTVEA